MIRRAAIFRTTLLAALCLAAWAVPAGAQHDPRAGGWAHQYSSLPKDPRVTWGTLENGMRYAILPHAGVPGRVSLRLMVLAGSLDEEDNERGLAHFVEHMAFNGTSRFQADEITAYFQRLGMEFGSDVNAFTGPDHTVYGMEFTRSEPSLIRDGFVLFRDFAQGIAFDPAEIDRERGVILSELRIHDGVQMRVTEAANQFFFRGLRFPERIAIGKVGIIQSAQQKDFLRFYRRLYRPDLMVLVATGDLDVNQFESWTREFFGDLPRPSEPLPVRHTGQLVRERGPRVASLPVMDIGSASVRAASLAPEPVREDSLETRRQLTHRRLATQLLGGRMQRQIMGASGAMAEYMRLSGQGVGMASVSVGGGNEWEHGLVSTDNVIRYTYQNGFQEAEVEHPRQRLLLDIEMMRAQAGTLDPAPLADNLVESVVEGKVYVGFEREMEMQQMFTQEASAQRLSQAFRESWDPDRLAYFVHGDIKLPEGGESVAKALRNGRRSQPMLLLQLPLRSEVTYKPSQRRNPGEVVETSELPDFNARLMRFQNNIRFNFIPSRQEPGLVRAVVRVGNGLFETGVVRPGLREFALDTVMGSGTGRYRPDQVRTMLEESMINFSFDVADHDAFSFRAVCSSNKLETFFGLVSEFLADPQFSRSAQQSVKFGAAMARMSQSFGVPDGVRAFQDHIFRGDGRFSWGTPFDYHALGITHVRNWLGKALENGYVEVSLIGDISDEEAVTIAARTLGTLPSRRADKRIGKPKPVEIKAPPGYARLEFVGEDHQAAALGLWAVQEETDLDDRLGLLVVSRVLEQRMRMLFRERLGLAYSPSADFMAFLEYPEFALIQAQVDCAPEDASRIARSLAEISTELGTGGMTDIEFTGALNPVYGHLEQALRTNELLLDRLLKRAQERPDTVEELRAVRDGALRALTLESVNRLAADVLKPGNTRTAAIVPKPFVGLFQIGSGGGQDVIGR